MTNTDYAADDALPSRGLVSIIEAGSGLQNSTTCAVGFFRRRFRSITAHISSRKSVSSAT
jgi:hypothetical protein